MINKVLKYIENKIIQHDIEGTKVGCTFIKARVQLRVPAGPRHAARSPYNVRAGACAHGLLRRALVPVAYDRAIVFPLLIDTQLMN